MDLDLNVLRGHIVDLAHLDLTLCHRLEDALLERTGGLAEGHLADDEGLGVELLYLRAHLNHAAALAVVVF